MSTVAEKRHLILHELNLEPIIVKAMDEEEGEGWSLEYAVQVSGEYRKYLVLCLENPDEPIVPSGPVDDFWHQHILDTAKYAEDCQRYLGFFLHHFPYFGMRGEQDAEHLQSAWAATLALYRRAFGESPQGLWQGSRRCPSCGRRCRRIDDAVFFEQRPSLAGMQSNI